MEAPNAQNPCDETLEEAIDLSILGENFSGSALPLGVLDGENSGGFGVKINGVGISNVEFLNQGIDIEKKVSVQKVDSEVKRNEEVIVEKSAMKRVKFGSESQLNEVDSAREGDGSDNGISLFVEVFGPPNEHKDEAVLGSDRVYDENEDLLPDNGKNPSVVVSKIHNGTIEGEVIYDQECKLSVGDLVWVKTKSQSWWPGLILDPLHAPKDATKSDPRASVLVKYFGNASFVWCSPLQLKPFVENFEHISVQGDSMTFAGAVKKALEEFGRRVKLQMTCSCILKENQTIPTALLEGNSGSKDLVLDGKSCRIDEDFTTRFEPADFIAFVKYLARDVSMPGMLELAATRNRLSAFYRAIGHRQLPMSQLRGPTDVKDGTEDELKQLGVSAGTVLEKKVEDISKNSEGGNRSAGFADIDICKLASLPAEEVTKSLISPMTTESKVSTAANGGGSGEKSGKSYETRERRRSKYLSPPYIDLGSGHNDESKGVSNLEQDINSTAGPSVSSPPTVNISGKKLQKKSKNSNSGHNAPRTPEVVKASSVDMLTELCFVALDCLYSSKNRHFNSAERFFSGFRRSVFHDEPNCKIDSKHITGEESNQTNNPPTLPRGEVQTDKASEMVEESIDWNKNADCPVSVGKDALKSSQPLPNLTSKRRRRTKKEIATMGSNTKPDPGFSDVFGIPTSGSSFIINFQEAGCLTPNGISVPKKRKKNAGSNLGFGLPDLNGNCITPSSLVEGSQVTNLVAQIDKPELKKRKKRDAIGNNAEVGSFLKDIPVMAPCLTGYIAELNNGEGMKGAASSNLNNEPPAKKTDTDGNDALKSSIVKEPWLVGLLAPGGPKKKKRKEKAPVDPLKANSGIPDLNGNAAEPSSLGDNLPDINSSPAEAKSPRKRRRRNKPVAWVPEINVSYNKVQTNKGEAPGTALLLKFAEGFPVPSREVLVTTFCGFGPIKELETQALNDSGSAQVVFVNGSDAGEAFRSLEKSSPFGTALVNYRLHHLSAPPPRASPAGTDLPKPATFQVMGGFKIAAKPSGLKPHNGETPDLVLMRKNLEMMTSMLEKAGDSLSPETRAKLEGEVKGLLKKVSSMVGSSSSS
ncbi:Serine/threonine-protein kinase [Actinidia chinensis var. chinensis]|uniref:Serine/threonine-protein kinase n=1 Tax=Actinidia chinensis var. chinensis TaxID=1590841 RepID=A0A2R6QGN2_ACTCC|nr:Serine/threonine-protein kinase [Actinidia chinensis var. chinensis]